MFRNLNEIVEDLKKAANLIVNYTFPKVTTREEADFDFLRGTRACIDGIVVNIYFTKSDYEVHFFETVQIIGEYSPFVPFSVVMKIGRVFFGDNNLTLTEFYQKNRKVYCWNLITGKDGQQLSTEHLRGERCVFEGCSYTYIGS